MDVGYESGSALKAVASMIARSEKAQAKLVPGTSQHTLLKNRISALNIALLLLEQEMGGAGAAGSVSMQELEKARAPIASLIDKSEKARKKLAPGVWQHAMLTDNLNALYIASRIIAKTLQSFTQEE